MVNNNKYFTVNKSWKTMCPQPHLWVEESRPGYWFDFTNQFDFDSRFWFALDLIFDVIQYWIQSEYIAGTVRIFFLRKTISQLILQTIHVYKELSVGLRSMCSFIKIFISVLSGRVNLQQNSIQGNAGSRSVNRQWFRAGSDVTLYIKALKILSTMSGISRWSSVSRLVLFQWSDVTGDIRSLICLQCFEKVFTFSGIDF